MANSKVWTITTSDDRSIQDIAKDLADAGLTGAQILAEIDGGPE